MSAPVQLLLGCLMHAFRGDTDSFYRKILSCMQLNPLVSCNTDSLSSDFFLLCAGNFISGYLQRPSQ